MLKWKVSAFPKAEEPRDLFGATTIFTKAHGLGARLHALCPGGWFRCSRTGGRAEALQENPAGAAAAPQPVPSAGGRRCVAPHLCARGCDGRQLPPALCLHGTKRPLGTEALPAVRAPRLVRVLSSGIKDIIFFISDGRVFKSLTRVMLNAAMPHPRHPQQAVRKHSLLLLLGLQPAWGT